VHRADADLQASSRLIHADGVWAIILRIEGGNTESLAQLSHSYHCPRLTVNSLAAHPVHCDGKALVRISAAKLAHDLDRRGTLHVGAAFCLGACNAQFRVSPTRPMQRHEGFVGFVVKVNYDFLDQDAGQALLCAGVARATLSAWAMARLP
jgi:hypothetical protein